tara:strand:- start:468 stop:731 length:264 start_codon:yes stop_codon:yes gene_type:complete
MNHRWLSFWAMVIVSFLTAFLWVGSIIYRIGITAPDETTKLMQQDLTQYGAIAMLFDIIMFLLILNILRPKHRWIPAWCRKGESRLD